MKSSLDHTANLYGRGSFSGTVPATSANRHEIEPKCFAPAMEVDHTLMYPQVGTHGPGEPPATFTKTEIVIRNDDANPHDYAGEYDFWIRG